MTELDILCDECKEKINAVLTERFSYLGEMSKFKALRKLAQAANEIHTIYYENACDACKNKLMAAARK